LKLQITIPRRSLDNLRFLLHPSRAAALYLIFLFALLAFASSTRNPSPVIRGIGIALFLAGLVTAWFGLIARRLAPPRGLRFCLALGCGLLVLQRWWKIPYANVPIFLLTGIVAFSAASYGVSDALLILALLANLQLMLHQSVTGAQTGFEFELGLQVILLAGLAILLGYLTSGQRRKILALREEVMLAKSESAAYSTNVESNHFPAAAAGAGEGKADMESLESGIETILHRIQEYFQAQTVLLYQPYGKDSLKLRHAVSETGSVHVGHVLDAQSTPLGALSLRGITCNWNLDDPDSEIRSRDISYYTNWQQVRNVAGCPLKMQEQVIGVLILDRNLQRPFTGLEMKHLEIFAIQLVELIQIGKRYLEQLDRNTEYRIFYQAMSRLARSLATKEVLEALASVCQEVAPSTHILIALLDESRLSYEIAYTHGTPMLQGCKVDSHGRTWLSWMLNSKSGPIMLRDIRSHVSSMPIASPKEEPLPVRSVLLIPLIAEGSLLGVVLLGSTKVDLYRHWHMRILTSICSQASANIENSLLHRKVETEALSDGLTHLYNHRFFQERLQSECSRVKRSGGSLSLLMIDIDHFKKVNDTYGHRVGDMVLQQTAGILKGRLRSEDTIARYGGEEFVVILSGSGKKGALRMAERSRLAVKRAVLFAEEHRIGASVSIGTATFPEDASEPWELIERADRALYAAKEQGRNRVVQYHMLGQEGVRMTGIR
jgi:diguanylate cyclase (GGDEF)-like protein